MCDFQCIYERGGLCLLDDDVCTDTCSRNNECRVCENECRREEREVKHENR